MDDMLDYVEDEEDEDVKGLKIPKDLEGKGELDDYGDDADDGEEGEADLFGDGSDSQVDFDGADEQSEEKEDLENDVFALARENKELVYANEEMVDKIEKIEKEMLEPKSW